MKRAMIAATAVVLLVLVATVPFRPALAQAPVMPQPPAQPAPPVQPAPAGDPRVAQVRAAVERLGQRVLDVALVRQTTGNSAWIVVTPAAYSQPSFDAVFKQAQIVWWGTWGVVSTDPQETTLLVHGQAWNRYVIYQIVSLKDYAAFLSAYQAARTDPERTTVFKTLQDRTSYSVFDLDRGQFADAKDFSNKNFTR
ncbi:MAG: hypothetical protein ACT4P5_16405 [Armatimonadota bacterium]